MFNWIAKLLLGVRNIRHPSAINPAHDLKKQGDQFHAAKNFPRAERLYRLAIILRPDFVEAYQSLGILLNDHCRFSEAITCFQNAISIDPSSIDAHFHLGLALNDAGMPEQSIDFFLKAIESDPGFANAYNNLGNSFNLLGMPDKAVTYYQKALELKPDYAGARNNLIFILDMTLGATTQMLQEVRKQWNYVHAAALPRYNTYLCNPDPERRLRIGYVSADFKEHSAAMVFGAMLAKFDHSNFDAFAYSSTIAEDGYSKIIQQSVTCWKRIVGLSDEESAELIHQDGIDILVDLSGFSTGNRLLVFARKPAPIQITAWGYATSTGLDAMDVFFADPVIIPPEEKPLYTEQVRYLPSIVGYYRPQEFPSINALPAVSRKGVVFGSFNRLVKSSGEIYKIWAQVLLATPDSKMVLKTPELDNLGARARTLSYFTEAGVAPERIVMLGRTSWYEHMSAFNLIDITLDSFPHGGGVTTMEGLMMGVPVVTLRWPTIVGRLSASILSTLDLTDWIAETPEQYIEIAVNKVKELQVLADLRQQLRPRFTSSIIGDADAYVRAVEHEYRRLWHGWCKCQQSMNTGDV